MVDVSIIIPTFNRARFLGQAIDSALAQGEGVEVIVVDDGSTDDTGALMAAYGERIEVLRQCNAGPSAARNLGAQRARGEFLFFLDSDDWLEAGAVKALLAEARRLGPDRIPFGRATTMDEAGCPAPGPIYGYPHLPPGHELSLADLLGGVMPLCLSLVPRASFRLVGGLRTDLRLGEDHEFALRLHASGVRYVSTNVPTIRVRVHGLPRLSGARNGGSGRRSLLLWSAIADQAERNPEFDLHSGQALAKMIWVAGRDAARSQEQDAAGALFALARRLDRRVERISPWPLRLLGRAAGPYRAERCAELAKAVLRRQSSGRHA